MYSAINEKMARLPYTALGCVVKKDEHMERYGLAALDPYHLSLHVVVERAFYALGRQGQLHIVAESRNQHLDQLLEIAFLNLKVQGTRFLPSAELRKISPELHIREKSKNISGLQIADLLVSPMGRYVLGKRAHADWGVIEEKFYRHREEWEGAGLVVLPK